MYLKTHHHALLRFQCFWVCLCLFVFQLRNLTIEGCIYRCVHQDLINDLLRLSTSRYSQVWLHPPDKLMHSHSVAKNATWIASLLHQVRSKAQNVLFTALGTYNFCCRDIIPGVLEYLDPKRTDVTQQQFKVGLTPFTVTKTWKSLKIFSLSVEMLQLWEIE